MLADPEPAELTRALGFPTELDSHEADLVVVGAGPAGLSAAVYGASEGLRTTVLDAGAVGGQAGSSSLIRNYLGFPRGLGGGELAQRAYQQAWLFGVQFRLTHRATALEPRDGRHVVRTESGAEIAARAVVLALGVEYRRLDAPGLTELEGAGVFYGASMSEAQALAGESVYIVGGGNSAGQAALHLARYACKVRILVRGDGLAATMSQYLIDTIEKDPNVRVRTRTEVARGLGDGRLEALELRTPDGIETVPAAALVVLIGAHPHTEWLPEEIARDEWGYLATGPDAAGWPLDRAPLPLETSLPGVFAAGDVRARSVKRVASAAGSGALAVSDVHTYLALEPAARLARSPLILVLLLALPLVGLAILLAAPETDVHWQHHPSHFWLVLITAGLNAVLAYATGVAARRRGDRRVHLVSLSFLAASGFLALHALATPGVLLDKPNLGFVIATPVGLVLASAFAVLSAIDSEPIQPKYLERALLVLLALWGDRLLAFFPEVDDSVVPARLSSEMVALSIVGVACYTYAVVRYLDLYRERRSRLVLGFTSPSCCSRRRWSRWRSAATGKRPGGNGTC